MSIVGQRIRDARKTARMTQEELAKHVGTSKQNIWKYESGVVTNIPMDRLVAIASALEVPAEYLLGWDPLPPVQPVEITDEESHLLGLYNQLNRSGKDLVMQTAVTAVASGMYEEKEK